MKIDEIKELIQALEHSSLTSLEINQGDTSVKLEKHAGTVPMQSNPSMTPMEAPITTNTNTIAISMENNLNGQTADAKPKGTAVTCPLVGVFYAAPSPNDKPFVAVGDVVKKGDVLCIVEAMKLMNELTAEQDGVITEICAENGQVVEYGQPLFYIA